MPAEEQAAKKAEGRAEYDAAKAIFGPIALMFALIFSFGPIDLLWIGFAALSAIA